MGALVELSQGVVGHDGQIAQAPAAEHRLFTLTTRDSPFLNVAAVQIGEQNARLADLEQSQPGRLIDRNHVAYRTFGQYHALVERNLDRLALQSSRCWVGD